MIFLPKGRDVPAASPPIKELSRLLVKVGARRPGDPPVLIASSERVRKDLGWDPRFPDLETIIRHAWDWRCRNPEGYASPVTRELVAAS